MRFLSAHEVTTLARPLLLARATPILERGSAPQCQALWWEWRVRAPSPRFPQQPPHPRLAPRGPPESALVWLVSEAWQGLQSRHLTGTRRLLSRPAQK